MQDNPYNSNPVTQVDSRSDVLLDTIFEREYTFSDIFSATSRLIRKHFLEIAIPGLLLGLIMGLVNTLSYHFIMNEFIDLIDYLTRSTVSAPLDSEAPRLDHSIDEAIDLIKIGMMKSGLIAVGSMLFNLIPILFISLFIIFRMHARCSKSSQTIAQSLRLSLQRVPMLAILSMPFLIFGILGMFFCLLPGIVILAYSTPLGSLVGPEQSGFVAIGRSFKLMHGRIWKSVAIFLILFMGYYIIGMLIQMPFSIFVMANIMPNMQQDLEPLANMIQIYQSPGMYIMQFINALPGGFHVAVGSVVSAVMYQNYNAADARQNQE